MNKKDKARLTLAAIFTATFIAIIVLFSSCVGDSYYNNLNSEPTISISSHADTIKVSPVAFTDKVNQIVTCTDYNMNMRTLSYKCSNDTNIILFDDKNVALPNQIQIGNNIEKLNQQIIFKAIKEGDYTIKFDVKDAFSLTKPVEYSIHAFNNLLPVAVVKSCTLVGSLLSIDMSTSYDTDEKYGGEISSYIIYIDGERTLEFDSPQVNVILSQGQISNINSNLHVAVRDNDKELSQKIKPTVIK